MSKDDTKGQIPLFDLPPQSQPVPPPVPETTETEPPVATKPAARKAPVAKPAPSPAGSRARTANKAASRAAAPPARRGKGLSGLVPPGDVRLTANIRQDLHLKLKIAAAHRRTTIGEIIEELVEQNL